MIFPNVRFFTDANPDFDHHWIPRRRVDTGFHPFLAKAAFPHMTMMYFEDWEDFHKLEVPYLFERVVIADRSSAARAVLNGEPVFSPAFEHGVSNDWWEPIRRNLAVYFGSYDTAAKKRVITYIQRQTQTYGAKLRDGDHAELVSALRKLQSGYGYEVNIVSSLDSETSWNDRMSAITKSTVSPILSVLSYRIPLSTVTWQIVIGVHSDDLFDFAFLRTSQKSTIMEFFPPQTFSRDRQLVAQSLRINYLAWWRNQ